MMQRLLIRAISSVEGQEARSLVVDIRSRAMMRACLVRVRVVPARLERSYNTLTKWHTKVPGYQIQVMGAELRYFDGG